MLKLLVQFKSDARILKTGDLNRALLLDSGALGRRCLLIFENNWLLYFSKYLF